LANDVIQAPRGVNAGVLQADRDGPDHLYQLSLSALRRWRSAPERLDGELYRPETLKKVEDELDALGPWEFDPPADLLATEKVGIGDSLSKFAHRHYGDAELWPTIYEANRDRILDPNEIFPGLEVRIPRLQGD
jgi:nucleoid-associated protein YgaU